MNRRFTKKGDKEVRYRYFRILLLLVVSLVVCGCNNQKKVEKKKDGEYYLYYANDKSTGLQKTIFTPKSKETLAIVEEMLKKLATNTTENDITRTIPEQVKVQVKQLEDGKVLLDFNESYKELNSVDEILLRSSVILTLCQLKDVDKVRFFVNDGELKDNKGNTIGDMKASDFVDNSDDLITAFQHRTLTLYYADESGEKLKAYTCESVLSNNVSLEQYVVDQIINGPPTSEYKETISSNVKVSSVYTEDDICYVDFTDSFLKESISIKDYITIYSIVNSLSEISNISKVQILVDGKSDVVYHNSMSLAKPFQRNLDYVNQQEEGAQETGTEIEYQKKETE